MPLTPDHEPDRAWADRRAAAADRTPVRLASPGAERCDRCGASPPRLFFVTDTGELLCGECRCPRPPARGKRAEAAECFCQLCRPE